MGAWSCILECKQVKTRREILPACMVPCCLLWKGRDTIQKERLIQSIYWLLGQAGLQAVASLDVEKMFIHGNLHLECTCYLENCQAGKHCPSCFFYMHLQHSEILNFLWNATKKFLCVESLFWVFEDSKSLPFWIKSLLTVVLFETWAFKLLTHTALGLKEMTVL